MKAFLLQAACLNGGSGTRWLPHRSTTHVHCRRLPFSMAGHMIHCRQRACTECVERYVPNVFHKPRARPPSPVCNAHGPPTDMIAFAGGVPAMFHTIRAGTPPAIAIISVFRWTVCLANERRWPCTSLVEHVGSIPFHTLRAGTLRAMDHLPSN